MTPEQTKKLNEISILPERIRSKIKITNKCWEWMAALTGKGYGCIYFDGKNRRAHRVVYGLLLKKVPTNKLLCHKCGNRKCVKPSHLYIGDNSTNGVDRVKDGNHWAANKVKCPSGHSYSGKNLITTNKGYRACRLCQNTRNLKYWRLKYGKKIA